LGCLKPLSCAAAFPSFSLASAVRIGVAVAIIKNTNLNFAIPGEKVHAVVRSRVSGRLPSNPALNEEEKLVRISHQAIGWRSDLFMSGKPWTHDVQWRRLSAQDSNCRRPPLPALTSRGLRFASVLSPQSVDVAD